MNTYLLDTSSYMHRAYHASKTRPFCTKEGVPCAGTHQFKIMVERLLRDSVGQGDRLLAAVDMHAPTFRTTLYPEYKAQRKQPDADFLAQVPGTMRN